MTAPHCPHRLVAVASVTLIALLAGLPGRAHAQSPSPHLVLSTNQSIFGTGTTLEATLGVEYGGAPVAADLVFGVLLPDGDTVVTFQGLGLSPVAGRLSQPASLRSLLPGVTLSAGLAAVIPDLFRYTFQGNEPLGTYQMFFAATRPGAFADGRIDGGDLLAVQQAAFSVQPPAVATTDPSRATTTLVPMAGGTVVATAVDGTTFTLRVPAGALTAPTAITLTPVTTMTGVPGAMQNILAVRAEPAGLTFAVPATLLIHPASTGAGRPIGFSTSSAGSGLGLSPAVTLASGDILLTVSHFSVLGSGVPADFAALTSGSSSAAFIARYNALGTDQAAVHALLAARYREIFPVLLAASFDTASLIEAIDLYFQWDGVRLFESLNHPLSHQALAAEGQGMLANALRSALARLNATCAATQDLTVAEDLLRLQSLGAALFRHLTYAHVVPIFLPQPLPITADLQGLDLPSVVAGLCVRVRITDATFPSNPQVGVTAPLAITAGLVFGANPPRFTPELQVIADAVNASPAQRTGVTNAQGVFATTFTPSNPAVSLNVLATLVDPSFPFLSLAALTDTRNFAPVSGVVVTPAQTTIVPGASRQFSAVVSGNANQAVTWTVSGGGTISATGLFTSSGALGAFFVTATSVADANSVGVAQVTVANPLTGALAISTSAASPTVVTITAVRAGVITSFSGPIAEAAARVSQAQQHLAAVTSLDSLNVIAEVPVAFALSLPNAEVAGSVVLHSGRTNVCGAADVVPSTMSVEVGSMIQGTALLRACGASITLVAQTLGQSNLDVSPARGGVARVTAGFTRFVHVTGCNGGVAEINVAGLRNITAQDNTSCTMTLNGTVGLGVPFGAIQMFRNVNSTFGTIHGSDLAFVGMEANTGTSVAIQMGNIVSFGNPTAPFTFQNNVGIPLTAIQMGNIEGAVTIRNNVGFTNAQAQAFAAARTVGGAVTISGNQP